MPEDTTSLAAPLFFAKVKRYVKGLSITNREARSRIASETKTVSACLRGNGRNSRTMQSQNSLPLPEYKNPPINEVFIAIEFVPIVNWQSVYSGLYWASVKDSYPFTETHPPLPPSIEIQDDNIFANMPPRIEFVSANSNRIWLLSPDKTNLLQLQRDRFVVNWRQVVGDEAYPRFDQSVLPTFKTEFAKYKSFIENTVGGKVDVKSCELAYYNNLVMGVDWENIQDALSNFSYFRKPTGSGYLPSLETINMSGVFKIPNSKGRLGFNIAHALRPKDMKQIIQFSLTARSNIEDSSDAGIARWLLNARECIVRCFTDLTTERAHERWGRIK